MGLQIRCDLARKSRDFAASPQQGGVRVFKRILGVSLLAIVLACASGGGSGSSQGDRGSGSQSRSDPGMGDSGRGSSGIERSSKEFRTVYFDFDQSALREDGRRDLRHNADIMKSDRSMRVEIQGNADERGSTEYNLALGMRRADTAKRYITDLGIAASRVATISYGEENPAVRGHNEAAWARNRRDDFVVR